MRKWREYPSWMVLHGSSNTLWHEADEPPIPDKNILTKFRDNGQFCYDIDNVCWLDDKEDWETHWVNNSIVAWCYIDDLLNK